MAIKDWHEDDRPREKLLKFGAAHLFNKKFEYFQALTLGAENGLMGFRKNRYT